MFETFDHTADLGLRVTAVDLDELFVEAARGLSSLLVEDPARLGAAQLAEITVPGDDWDLLLFDLLSELLFRFETTGFLGREFVVARTTEGLQAEAHGEVIQDQPHRLAREVKAITYHGLKVEQQDDRWLAEVIVDI